MDFPLVALKLLVFKVCVIFRTSEIGFFIFSDTERVNQKSFKTLACKSITFFKQFQQMLNFFLVFHQIFNPFAPCIPLGGW